MKKPSEEQADAKLDKILTKVEGKKEEEKEAMKKKLAQLKAKEIGKIIEKKEAASDDKRVQPTAPTAVPNIYDNSTLFNRDTVEQRLEKYQDLLQGEAPKAAEEEQPPKSWIQIKAAAMAERKNNPGTASQKSKLSKRLKKAPIHPTTVKMAEENKNGGGDLSPLKRDRGASDEANLMDKTEAPSDPEVDPKADLKNQGTARGPKIEEERKSEEQ